MLVRFCLLFVAHSLLVVTFCLLLLSRYSLLYACYYFPSFFVIHCSLFCPLLTSVCSFLLSFRLTFDCNFVLIVVLVSFSVIVLRSHQLQNHGGSDDNGDDAKVFFHTLRSFLICSFTQIFYSFDFF